MNASSHPAARWITPFAYIDDAGALHYCCDKLLEAVGLPVNEENILIAKRELLRLAEQTNKGGKVVTRVHEQIALDFNLPSEQKGSEP